MFIEIIIINMIEVLAILGQF